MNISAGEIMANAYRIVVRYRVLWALGFFAALVSGAGSNNNFRFADNKVYLFNIDLVPTPGLVAWMVVLALVVGIVLLLLRGILDASLIIAVDRSRMNRPPLLTEAWREGAAAMWRVIGLNLIFAAFVLVVAALVLAIAGLSFGTALIAIMLSGGSTTQLGDARAVAPAAGVTVAVVIVLLVLALAVGVVLALVLQLAQRAAVLDKQPLRQALSTGWRMVRSMPGSVARLAVFQFLVNVVIGMMIAVAVAIVVLPVAILLLAGGGVRDDPLFATMSVLLIIFTWLVTGAILALPTAWNSTLWTLFYRRAGGNV